MKAHLRWTVSWFEVPRLHLFLLAVISIFYGVIAAANIQLTPEVKDTGTNFAVGINLAETGVYGPSPNSVGWRSREPFVPFVVAGYHVIRKAVGLPTVDMRCLEAGAQETKECQELSAPYRHVQIAFLVLAAVCTFLLVYRTTGNAPAAYVAFVLTAFSGALLGNLHRLYTEAAAAALMTLTAVLLHALLARPRASLALGLGVSMAALTLTKIVFAYFWAVVLLLLLLCAVCDRSLARRLVILCSIVFVSYAAIVGAWMTRNYIQRDAFELGDSRSYRVLAARASYNTMSMDEYWAGYLYFLPSYGVRGLAADGFDPKSYERFSFRNPDGFRSTAKANYAEVYATFNAIKKKGGAPARKMGSVPGAASKHFRDMILADPWAHLRVGALLAFGAVFIEPGFGIMKSASEAGRVADVWSMEIPQPRYRFTRLQRTLYNLGSALAIIALPVALWFRGRDIAGLVIAFPVFYNHGVYALASHFIPRYAEPEIPLRNAALCILAALIASALINSGYRIFPRAIGSGRIERA